MDCSGLQLYGTGVCVTHVLPYARFWCDLSKGELRAWFGAETSELLGSS